MICIPSAARAEGADAEKRSPRIVNIINFIRQCEPRIDWITPDVLYNTVVEQVNSLKTNHLKGTFLLQYDALMDERYQKLLKALPPEQFEIGAWWEIPQPLVEKSGYTWRGRYPWDWHADVGFSTGYSPEEREKLTDTFMADFKRIFGSYPKSVGSWFIDEHTLQYMAERYGIEASCNCKDQIGTDGYTLWGGYWNQGYYPSKKNAYMPAQNAENQIQVPIFRMLGSDPIHQYDSGLGGDHQKVVSLEPVYEGGGGNAEWCQWYFDAFVNGAAMGYAYTQAGQENSFTWKKMSKGFNIQMPLIAKLQRAGKVEVKTLGETGKWFKEKYKVTPPTSVTVLNDHSKKNQKTVWFNARFYRANLLWDQGTLRFRDIHLFDETVASDYLTKKGTSSQCFYFALPVVDGFNWSTAETVAGLRLRRADAKELKGGMPIVDDRTPGELTVRWPLDESRGEVVITFTEKTLTLCTTGAVKDGWYLELSSSQKAALPFCTVTPKKLACVFRESPYSVSALQGTFTNAPGSALRILPEDGKIRLDMSIRSDSLLEGEPVVSRKGVLQVPQDVAKGRTEALNSVALPRLTPKPLEVSGVATPVLDLSGKWRFNHDVKPEAWQGDVDFGKWREITVPGQWTAQGYWLKQDPALRAIYTRIVEIPNDWAGQRIKLRFDGFVGPAWVYINGQEVGVRKGFLRQPEGKGFFTEQWGTSFTPFEWDVTSCCKPGAQNRLVVVMARSYDLYDHADAGGILRPVRLLAVPPLNLSSFHVSTELDDAYQDAVVKAEVELSNEGVAGGEKLSAEIRISAAGKIVVKKRVDLPALNPAASLRQMIEIPIRAPKKWDPEHPNLYLAECVLLVKGKERMRCERRFGFREVEVRGKQFLLNGVAIKARGVNRHETHPILGRGLTDNVFKQDAELFRASNVNFIRTSHYPPDERFVDACDEAGLLVEVEAPFWGWYWGTANLGVPLDDEKGLLMRRSTLEMVQRDRSHPSVVLWSLANECEWNSCFVANREAVKALDPTRPTVFDHSFYGPKAYDNGLNEVAASHYPGEAIFKLAPPEKRPVFLGEFAHVNCYNREELGSDPGLRALWGPSFVAYWERIYASKDIMGGTIWCGLDSVFFLETSGNVGVLEQNTGLDQTFAQTVVAQPGASVYSTGCGPWGLFDGWRRAKPEQWYVKAAYAPIQLPSPVIALTPDSDTAELAVENRNHFSNLSEFRFEWTAGQRTGIGHADAPAQTQGTLLLKGLKGLSVQEPIELRALSPLGFEVNRWRLKRDAGNTLATSVFTTKNTKSTKNDIPLMVTETEREYLVTAGSLTYRVDKTGALPLRIERGGVPVVTGGPHLMISRATAAAGFTGHDPAVPASAVCSNWIPGSVTIKTNNIHVELTISGTYHEAAGHFVVTIKPKGFEVAYDFTVQKELGVLQIGTVLDLVPSLDHLYWKRKATLTVYPDDHIGRPEGDAPAFYPKVPLCGVFGPLSYPGYSWSHDATARGCNDFRSTKYNVFEASLRDKNGAGLFLESNGEQHLRCWVLKEGIRMLAADYSGYGSERHCKFGVPKTMKPGERVTGRALFEVRDAIFRVERLNK